MRILPVYLAVFGSLIFSTAAHADSQKISIGRYQSRAIWTQISADPSSKKPVVILIPGSGPNGPEEEMTGDITGDGQAHSLFGEFSTPFNQAGVSTLQLGKPGIDYYSPGDADPVFYNKVLYENLHWRDLLNNLADGLAWVKTQPGVDLNRIYVLGHSEGTQVATDYAAIDKSFAGIILLGYAGEDVSTTLNWQIFHRDLEDWIIPNVDTNHDGYVSKAEADLWPEFQWDWTSDQEKLSYAEIDSAETSNQDYINDYNSAEKIPLYQDGIFNRGPLYTNTASVEQTVYVFNGSLDVETPPEQSLKLDATCKLMKKKNCYVTIVPGVGHGFSPPKAPRAQKLLDATLGPVTPAFQSMLFDLAKKISR
jgi:pimeloyl-ACP methyl ester carboxylesterase